jgi:hypothetical protein
MSYTTNIPAANDNPSVSQGEIQANFNEINTWVNVNHTGFGGNEGKHNIVEMTMQTNAPATLINESALYSANQTVASATTAACVMMVHDTLTNAYQLTRPIDSNFAKFGTFTNYNLGTSGGWTFLPGGLLLQYGTVAGASVVDGYTIMFPQAFINTPYSVLLTETNGNSTVSNKSFQAYLTVSPGTVGTGGFSFRYYDNSGNTPKTNVYWQAIGV